MDADVPYAAMIERLKIPGTYASFRGRYFQLIRELNADHRHWNTPFRQGVQGVNARPPGLGSAFVVY
jgi:hypothetical protein